MENEIYHFIKFGKKNRIDNLLSQGDIFFNLPSNFNNLSKINDEQGDENEGVEWILNDHIDKINVQHPSLGSFDFKSVEGKLSKIRHYNDYFLSYSLYAITSKNFDELGTHKIDEKMLEFGESAIVISNPQRFLNSIFLELHKNNIAFESDIVEYRNFDNIGKTYVSPFVKKDEHSHQMEFRIIIRNTDDKPKNFSIGSVANYGDIVSSKFITETIWERKGK